jgi:hypothetical protein
MKLWDKLLQFIFTYTTDDVGSSFSTDMIFGNATMEAAVPELPGDYNGNGSVDAADYVVWRKTLGNMVAPFAGADGNGSSQIDSPDYNVWRGNFGETTGAESSLDSSLQTAVPEPTSLLLLFIAAGFAVGRRK